MGKSVESCGNRVHGNSQAITGSHGRSRGGYHGTLVFSSRSVMVGRPFSATTKDLHLCERLGIPPGRFFFCRIEFLVAKHCVSVKS